MRLILVRHPKPQVAAGICYGRTDLTVAPQEQAQVLASLLASLPAGAALYSSPLRRCAELAARLPHRPLTFDARLAEMDFGAWEMQPWDAIARAQIDAWADDLADYHPGGGESVLQMAVRVHAFYADLQRQQGADASGDADDNANVDAGVGPSVDHTAIIICHAGTMRLLSACHAGLAPREAALHAAQNPHAIAYGASLILHHRSPL
ncbi:histidine phosphatase family protein [Rugamonas sp.]|uniref:histidine phosphatase family protein n=1 Tax=Rugamonas sp. TaxID=1926287 RepID=UPI0025DEA6F4|nr:histidine phosphatase family protein [Rugamonas sp.]